MKKPPISTRQDIAKYLKLLTGQEELQVEGKPIDEWAKDNGSDIELDDPEDKLVPNMKQDKDRILISSRRLLGAVAKWSVEQSPYSRPDNLELVLDKLFNLTKIDFEKGELGFIEFADRQELVKFIRINLRKIPEYYAWNERKNGNPAPFNFTSRYDVGKKEDPDNDFIDLDALERNVTNELISKT